MNETASIIVAESSSDDADGPAPGLGCDPDKPPEQMNDHQTALTIQCAIGLDDSVDLAWLEIQLNKSINQIAKTVRRVAVKLIDDHEMTHLHQAHRNDKTTTDVLTFENSAEGEAIDVDIAICVDVAQRQASNRNHSINHELLLYALHGLLHCAGFDDSTAEQSQAMHEEEDRILAAIGVGSIYKREDSGHDESCENHGRDRGFAS